MWFSKKLPVSSLVTRVIEFAKDKPDLWKAHWLSDGTKDKEFSFRTNNKFYQSANLPDSWLYLYPDGNLVLITPGWIIDEKTGKTTETLGQSGRLIPQLNSLEKKMLSQAFTALSHEKILRGLDRAEILADEKK